MAALLPPISPLKGPNQQLAVQQFNRDALSRIREGDFDGAARILHEAVALCHDGTMPKELATSLNNLGCLAKRLGKLLEARRYLQDAVNAETAAFGQPMLSTQLNLSTVYTALNEVPLAIAVAQQVVDRAEPRAGDDFLPVALHNLAIAQLSSPEVAIRRQGIETLKIAHSKAVELVGPDAPITATLHTRLQRYHKAKHHPGPAVVISKPSYEPAPPSAPAPDQHRNAASRALRALDFGTPTEDTHRTKPQAAPASVASSTATEAPIPDLPSRAEAMAGATFVLGSAQPQPGPKTSAVDAPTSTQGIVSSPSTFSSAAAESGLPPIKPVASPAPNTARAPSVASTSQGRPRSTSGEKPFLRFVSNLHAVPPPVPISFREVKAELALKRAPLAADEVQRHKPHHSKEQVEVCSVFKRNVKEKARRQQQEREEERQVAERQKREAALAAERAAYEAKLGIANRLRQHYSARKIQRLYQRYRALVAPSRRKKARVLDSTQREVIRARLVRRYAMRWLKLTAGPRLLARLLNNVNARKRLDYETVVNAVKCLQRCWRRYSARQRRRSMALERLLVVRAVDEAEKIFFAASTIQRWVRQRQAKERAVEERARQYTGHLLVIQRWGRLMIANYKQLYSALSESRRRHFAATKIQAVWRGRQSRLMVAVIRLKHKIAVMRQRERAAAVMIQQSGRGLRNRLALYALRLSVRRARLTLPSNLSSTVDEKPVAIKPQARAEEPWTLAVPSRYLSQLSGREAELRAVGRDIRQLNVEVVDEPQAKQHLERYRHAHTVRNVNLQVAEERELRQIELDVLRSDRAAKCIQRRWRRWQGSLTEDRRAHLTYYRAELQHQHYLRRERELEEKIHREKLRVQHDLARQAREAKEEVATEVSRLIEDLPSPPATQREVEDRETEARRLRALERDLKRTIESERLWLRTLDNPNGVRTFRTIKEQRRDAEFKRRANNVFRDRATNIAPSLSTPLALE